MRFFVALVLVCVVCGGALGVGAADEEGAIRIGVIGPMSGEYAAIGADLLAAVELAADVARASGGLMDRPIELHVADDGCQAEMAATAARRLVELNVVAVVGGYCSAATIVEAQALSESGGMPFVNGASDLPELTERGYQNFFRTVGRNDQQGPYAAEYMVRELGSKRVALLHDDTAYSAVLASETGRAVAALGAEVVYKGRIEVGRDDYTHVLREIANTQPDALYFTGYYVETGRLLLARSQLGLTFPLLAGSANNEPALLEIAGSAAEGMIVTTPPLSHRLDSARDSEERFLDINGRSPSAYAAYTYDAAQALFAAMRLAESVDAALVRSALRNVDVHGATGALRFDEKGDRVNAAWSLLQVVEGQFVPVESATR